MLYVLSFRAARRSGCGPSGQRRARAAAGNPSPRSSEAPPETGTADEANETSAGGPADLAGNGLESGIKPVWPRRDVE